MLSNWDGYLTEPCGQVRPVYSLEGSRGEGRKGGERKGWGDRGEARMGEKRVGGDVEGLRWERKG